MVKGRYKKVTAKVMQTTNTISRQQSKYQSKQDNSCSDHQRCLEFSVYTTSKCVSNSIHHQNYIDIRESFFIKGSRGTTGLRKF